MTVEQVDDSVGDRPQALVADDDDDMRKLLAATLEREGFHVLEASNGEQLMTLFRSARRANPNSRLVVVSDIGMPVPDGIQVTRMLRAIAPCVPVILVTAYSDPATLQSARDAGATSVIRKPIERLAFVRAALRAIEVAPAPSTVS